MEELLDPAKFSMAYLLDHEFGIHVQSDWQVLMLCPVDKLKNIPLGTRLTSISGQTMILHQSHDQQQIDGKPNPFYFDKDYRYYGGPTKLLAWGILIQQ